MYNSNSKNGGKYHIFSFIKRGLLLVSPSEFHRFKMLYYPEMSFIKEMQWLCDYYMCMILYGATVSDYFEYEFWKKKRCIRKEYITMLKSIRMQKFFNHGSPELLVNKKKFNAHFAELRGIHNFYFEDGGSVNDFITFINNCNRNIIAKTFWGASGQGIYKPDVTTDDKAKDVYETLKKNENYFCEECFVQTGVLSKVNPYCVNTVRVYTLYDGERVHIMNAMIRFGGGTSCVDNIHSGGMSCEIEPKLGVVVGPGYNLKNEKFIVHPLTKYVIPGIKIPHWQDVLECCTKAALLFIDYGYIGWDVAVSDNKVCLIEGNEVANVDLPQTSSQRGIKKDYWAIIELTRKNRKNKKIYSMR